MLFAEGDEIPTGVWATLYTLGVLLAGSGVPWVWKQLMSLRADNLQVEEAKRKAAREDDDRLYQRMDKERAEIIAEIKTIRAEASQQEAECQSRLDKMREELTEVRLDLERAIAWIRQCEFQMANANQPYRSWKDTPIPPHLEQMRRAEPKP